MDILTCPIKSVYAFVNEHDKAMYIHYSTNTPVAIARHVSALKQGVHFNKGLQKAFKDGKISLAILEDAHDARQLRYRWNYYIDYYSNLGYNYYNNTTCKTRVTKEVDLYKNEIRVVVVNSKYERIVVGTFKTLSDAENFILRYYKNGKVYKLYIKKNK